MSEKFEFKTGNKSEIPTGKGRELNEALEEWRLLFQKVKNRVAEINEEVYTPFPLKKGKGCDFGLFAKSAVPEFYQRKPGEQLKLSAEAWARHWRSALLGRLIIGDRGGNIYRDLNLKGVGYFSNKEVKPPGELKANSRGDDFYGFLESKHIFQEYAFAEEFIGAGIRTPRTLAIVELDEIIYNGKPISLKEAREKKIVQQNFQPAVEVRAFRNMARIEDVCPGFAYGGLNDFDENTKKLLFEDAKLLISQELGRGENPLGDEEYLEWFAATLGKNLGLMHKNGWGHSLLSVHNITLACEICDLDSVRNLKNDNERQREVDHAFANSLKKFSYWLKLPEKQVARLSTIYHKSYYDVFSPEERSLNQL